MTRLIPSLASTAGVDLSEIVDSDPPVDVLDPSTRRQIRGALEHLGRRDLYDALGLPRDTPTTIVTARADEERQRWMKKAQVTAEKTAWLEIISHAQSHLTTPKARARYDRTLALEAEEQFDTVIAFALQGVNRVDLGTRGALIEEAAALGIGSERADRLLTRACRKLGVVARPRPCGSPLRGGRSHGVPPIGQWILPDPEMPQLFGSDRAEPGRAAIESCPLPALRRLAQMGVPGLPSIALG